MNTANKTAIQIVKDYIPELERYEDLWWRSSEFAQWSYSKTAAKEILELLEKDTNTPPLVVIEEYRDKMNNFACLNPKWSIMYSVAADIAEYMIDELIGSYY